LTSNYLVRSSVLGFSAIFNHLIRHHFVRDMFDAKGTENATKHNESRPTTATLPQALHRAGLTASTIREVLPNQSIWRAAIKAASGNLFWYMRRTTAEPPLLQRELTRRR